MQLLAMMLWERKSQFQSKLLHLRQHHLIIPLPKLLSSLCFANGAVVPGSFA
jgi:hypothetical protein